MVRDREIHLTRANCRENYCQGYLETFKKLKAEEYRGDMGALRHMTIVA